MQLKQEQINLFHVKTSTTAVCRNIQGNKIAMFHLVEVQIGLGH